jgi:hypothetical protein
MTRCERFSWICRGRVASAEDWVVPGRLFDTWQGLVVPGGAGGGASRDRTDDLRVANATLSQLSYGPVRLRN